MILSTSGSLPQRLRSPKVTSSVAVTVSRVLAISSVPLGLLLFVIPPGWISWWIPIHSALLAALIALSVFIHRPSNGQPWRWFCAAAVLTIPVVISLDRYRQTRRVGWGVVNVATMGVIVVAMGFAAVGSFRPFLRVPATARASRIGFGAIVIFAIVAIANLLDHRQSGVLGLLTSFLLGTAIAMAGVSTALFWTPLRRLGLTSSLLICSAAGLFELGQVIIEQVYDSTIPMKSLLAHPLIAMGLVAAAAFHPTMRQVGEPVLQLSERPLGFMPYFVYSAVLAAGGVMVAIDRQAWSDSRSRLFIDVIVAQLAIIAVLLTLLAARSTRKRGYRHARLRSELRGAIARNEIEAHFQPIVRVGDHAIAGYEALAPLEAPASWAVDGQRVCSARIRRGLLVVDRSHDVFAGGSSAPRALCHCRR